MNNKRLSVMLWVCLTAALSLSLWCGDALPSEPGEPLDMVLVSGGKFLMGNAANDSEEQPIHKVTLSSFYIGKYEVTQAEWQDVMGTNPSLFKEGNNGQMPVEQVSWYDAVEYCNKRSIKDGLKPCYNGSGDEIRCDFEADGYRLPTEAEWEYAARGGTKSRNYAFSGSNNIDDVAWHETNCQDRPHPVGLKQANELGLYDMSGNIWEWCWDWYEADYYKNSPQQDPRGAATAKTKAYRGGGGPGGRIEWLRTSARYDLEAKYKCFDMGFRVARGARGKKPGPKANLVLVQGGTFEMGSQLDRNCDKPSHNVTLRSFFIGKHEVTQEQYREVMGYNPSYWVGAKSPVDTVSWLDAIEYCNKRSLKEGLTPCYNVNGTAVGCDFTADGYRLPTEAEWEFAACGGVKSKGYQFSGGNDANTVAWNSEDGIFRAEPPCQKQPNELGIYDMSGNLLEWCWDWFAWDYYMNSPAADPVGPTSGIRRVLHGGSWRHTAPGLYPYYRFTGEPNLRLNSIGFRVARSVK